MPRPVVSKDGKKTCIVLAMHGAPPKDFPKEELQEFFMLHSRLEHSGTGEQALRKRYLELEAKMRGWPRTLRNDPFYAGSKDIAAQIEHELRIEVLLGFNEFCAPSLDDALKAAASRAEKVIIVTPMMTRGGEHAELEIPAAVRRAQVVFPSVRFLYAWPFEIEDIVRLLVAQIKGYI